MAAENLQARALLTADECLRLPAPVKSPDGKNILAPGDMLILPAGASPIYGKQILYFKDPVFDGRSKIRPPRVSDRIHQCAVKAEPIPCAPALAQIVVETPSSELDNFVKVDEQSNQFLGPQPTAQVAASAPAAAPAASPQASPAAAPPVVPAVAPSPAATSPADAVPAAAAAAAVAVAMAAVAATATSDAPPAADTAPAADPVEEYTAEQIAALDAEAETEETEDSQIDESVAKAMQAEAEEQAAAPAAEDPAAPSQPGETADDLLDFGF
jgi:hypothetical protein